jgi:hypothetical protein
MRGSSSKYVVATAIIISPPPLCVGVGGYEIKLAVVFVDAVVVVDVAFVQRNVIKMTSCGPHDDLKSLST